MKKLAALLLLVAGCAGVISSARATLDRVVADAPAREAVLVQLCAVVIDHSWDDEHPELGPLAARCDHAFDLYDQLKAHADELAALLDAGGTDEVRIAELAFAVARDLQAFVEAVEALQRGDA